MPGSFTLVDAGTIAVSGSLAMVQAGTTTVPGSIAMMNVCTITVPGSIITMQRVTTIVPAWFANHFVQSSTINPGVPAKSPSRVMSVAPSAIVFSQDDR